MKTKIIILFFLPLALLISTYFLFNNNPGIFKFLPSFQTLTGESPGGSLKNRDKQGIPLSNTLKFAIISDIHNETEKLKTALEKTRNNGSQFIIVTGDLTMEGTKEELKKVKEILDEEKTPYFAVPGNHDTWASHKEKNSNYFQEIFGDEFNSFEKCKVNTTHCPDNQKVKFILISNADYFKGYIKVESPTKGNQKTWLINELQDCSKITCLVFMHMPVNHPAKTHIMGENDTVITKQAIELEKLLVNNKIQKAFTGHIHIPEQYDLHGLHTVIVGAIGFLNNKINFMEGKIEHNKISAENMDIPLQ